MSTIFSKIIDREIPAQILHEDDECIAFLDIAAKAPVHFLVVPKKPLARIADATVEDEPLLGHLLFMAQKIAHAQGLSESGFRIVINSGPDGGETVPHLHVHVLGGRSLTWPPG